jgi:hypothetical protein
MSAARSALSMALDRSKKPWKQISFEV